MHRKELDVPSRPHQPLKPLSVHSVGPKIVNPPGPACMCDRTGGGKQLGKQGLLSVLVSAVAVLINLPLGNSCEKTEAGRFPSIAKYLNYLSTPSNPSWACSGGALRSSPMLFLQVCPCLSPPSSPLAAWICAALWAEPALLLFGGELVCRRQGWRNTAAADTGLAACPALGPLPPASPVPRFGGKACAKFWQRPLETQPDAVSCKVHVKVLLCHGQRLRPPTAPEQPLPVPQAPAFARG